MNKFLLAGKSGIVLLSSSVIPVWAEGDTGTFSTRYAQSHTNYARTLPGGHLADNYEMLPDWGMTTSFSWLNNNDINIEPEYRF